MNITQAKKIFFVGIGGIGTSALARLLAAEGRLVCGSDVVSSEITDELQKEGIPVVIGHRKENLSLDTDLLIYSQAVPKTNPERMQVVELRILELSYPEAVGEWARGKKVIAVAGTNGKTSTTAMIAFIMEKAGFDPSAIIGSKVLAWNSNARLGRSDYLVLEADEYRRAFLNYHPEIAVITNIEKDHLDYFKDLKDIKRAFGEFLSKIKPSGALVYNARDENSQWVARRFIGKKIRFGMENFKLKTPGDFNQMNASAAATVCRIMGISDEIIKQSLEDFKGVWRRFEKIGKLGNAEIVSDYAHHPTAVKLILDTAKEVYPGKKILAVFQPHQHNRTKMLFPEFVQAFCESKISNVIISEIFEVAGREGQAGQDISSQDLVREIQKCGKNVEYAKDLEDCEQQIRIVSNNYDMIILMGAGDIYKVADKLASS